MKCKHVKINDVKNVKKMYEMMDNNYLPKRMVPNINYFKMLGFKFSDVDRDSEFYKAEIPQNFDLIPNPDFCCVSIYDVNDKLLAGYIYFIGEEPWMALTYPYLSRCEERGMFTIVPKEAFVKKLNRGFHKLTNNCLYPRNKVNEE